MINQHTMPVVISLMMFAACVGYLVSGRYPLAMYNFCGCMINISVLWGAGVTIKDILGL